MEFNVFLDQKTSWFDYFDFFFSTWTIYQVGIQEIYGMYGTNGLIEPKILPYRVLCK